MTDTPGTAFGTPQAMANIDGANLLTLQKALTRVARRLLNGNPLRSPIGQVLPEDLADNAIVCVCENIAGLTTGRKWDPEKCSMLTFCIGHIQSSISNIRTSLEIRITEDTEGNIDDIVPSGYEDSEYIIIDALYLRQKYLELRDSLKNNPIDQKVLALIFDDELNTSKSIADRLHCSLQDVENSRQRIYRTGRKIGSNSREK